MSMFISLKVPSGVIVAGPLHRPARRGSSSRPATASPPVVGSAEVEAPEVETSEVESPELVAPEVGTPELGDVVPVPGPVPVASLGSPASAQAVSTRLERRIDRCVGIGDAGIAASIRARQACDDAVTVS